MPVLKGSIRNVEFEIDPGAITPSIARQFRNATGHPPRSVIYSTELDIDQVAELVWLSHLLRGTGRSLEQCEKGLTYETITSPVSWSIDDVAEGEPIEAAVAPIVAEVVSDPETPGGTSSE